MKVLATLRRIVKDQNFMPADAKEICSRILFTAYMASSNSSKVTRDRANLLAKEINCVHFNLSIEEVYNAFCKTAVDVFKANPKYKDQGYNFFYLFNFKY
jgi:NAD+ synthase (glutamine-hydrolysing)